ncbi:MAG: MFS transporter [Burkholderiales bacterium]|nr:MFS transporter [Burkholderiales bacterium]
MNKVPPGDIAVGVIVGRSSEYFDFFVYAIASVLVFPSVFFPDSTALNGTLQSFAVFALAFIARPFGTVAFMALQNRWGRQTKLTAALLLLGVCTAGIAFLPGTASIGFSAVVLLTLLRIGQGLAIGGSWDGLPSLLAINAPPKRRGWYAMLGQLGAPLGFALAAGLFAFLLSVLNAKDFIAWGWRYPFYVAFAINVVALFARLRLVSTDDYDRLMEALALRPTPIREMAQTQGYNVLVGALAALASYALFHVVTVFPLSWIKLFTQRSITEFLMVQMVGAALAGLCMLLSGIIADQFGRRTTLGWTAAAIAAFSGFAPTLLQAGTLGESLFIFLGFSLLGLSYGQASGAVTANFKPEYRYTGAALTHDLAWLTGAAFAPLITLGLSAHFGLSYLGLYLLTGAAGSLAALSLNRALELKD